MDLTRHGTLIDIFDADLDRASAIARDALLITASVIFIAAAAQVAIPWYPVPLTGGTFAVLLSGGLLGMWRAVIALVAYIGIGAAGGGVFASGGGWTYLTEGPTTGYIIGYVIAAGIVGWVAERALGRRVVPMAFALMAGTAVIYLLGVAWLANWEFEGAAYGWSAAVSNGVLPFLIGDFAKLAAVGALLPAGWGIAQKLGLRTGAPRAGML